MRTSSSSSSLLLSIFLYLLVICAVQFLSKPAAAQSFDYEPYPKLDFSFENLELKLSLQPDTMRVEGNAVYNLTANISGADSIILNAARMEIESVSLDGQDVDFHLNNDSLIVHLSDSSERGDRYELSIRYNSVPRFGLLRTSNGTVWSSLLPNSQRHWVPVVDNPHVTFSSTLEITVPSGYSVWATGRQVNEEITSVDNIRYTFRSKERIPASSLSFAAGDFTHSATSFGVKRINVAAERTAEESSTRQEVLQSAYEILKKAENVLGREFPFERLNIIILDDHHWETKSWGASTVFLFKNRGSWEAQLQRGIIGQWFGIQQREEQWKEADAISLYQALVVEELGSETSSGILKQDMPSADFSTVYDLFGPERWQYWQQGLDDWDNFSMKWIISGSMENVLRREERVVKWEDYARLWYRQSGQPLFEAPHFEANEVEGNGDLTASVSDSVVYRVNYHFDEMEGRLVLGFEALQGIFRELITLPTNEVYPGGRIDTSEITFTGEKDSLVVNVDPSINTYKINTSQYPQLYLDQYKPAPFLIYELRNAETVAERAEAAGRLGHHSDNPDLQLAIKDFMNRDLEPEVRAALLRSMAQITKGASGTEQMFVDALKSDHRDIREAGLTALQNYPGNEQIVSSVQNAAMNADDMQLFQKASKVLSTLTDTERYRSFVSQVVKTDTAGFRAIYATRELGNMGETDIAVKQAALYLDPQFDYGVREAAIKILIQNDHAPEDWISRAGSLMRDPDPRIRFLLMQGLANNLNEKVRELIRAGIQDEYDARVNRAMQELLES